MTGKQKKLRRSAGLYKKIFELVPVSIIIVDASGQVIDINLHHVKNIGGKKRLEKEDFLGVRFFDHPIVTGANLGEKYRSVLKGNFLDDRNVYFPETVVGHAGFYNIKASPIYDGNNLIGAVIIHENTTEGHVRSKKLEEANAALKVLLQQSTEARQEIEETILDNINLLIIPYIDELEIRLRGTPELSYLHTIISNIESITSAFVKNIRSEFLNLTPREIQVANLIRQGRTNKDIAQLLNLSVRTIEYYRGNLREKFNIKNKKVSLRSFLMVKS